MYYILYLSSLCRRRSWSDPHYTDFQYGNGYTCTVSVNRRNYTSEKSFDTPEQAQESAAMKAYLICRNISVSDSLAAEATAAAVARAVAAAAAEQFTRAPPQQQQQGVWAGEWRS